MTLKDLPYYEPIFTALSKKSRQSTPKLGSKKQTHSHNFYRDILEAQKIGPIQVEDIEDPPLSIDKILYDQSQIYCIYALNPIFPPLDS